MSSLELSVAIVMFAIDFPFVVFTNSGFLTRRPTIIPLLISHHSFLYLNIYLKSIISNHIPVAISHVKVSPKHKHINLTIPHMISQLIIDATKISKIKSNIFNFLLFYY